MKPICVVLTGAGISAESGIPTFRAEDGLWAEHKVEEVCTPEALLKNRAKVLDFYNQRAGSSNVLHLHGELNKARSSFDESYIVDCFGDQKLEDKDPNGHPMRPYIVFFGEMVPMLERAIDIVAQADVVLVIGTSLQVYPANGLVNEAPSKAPIYLIDPNPNTGFVRKQVIAIKEKAGKGVPEVVSVLLDKIKD